MRYLYFLISLMAASISLFSQELVIREIDETNFPVIKTYFNLIDANNNPMINSSVTNFAIEEDYAPMVINTISNPPVFNENPFSALLAIDLSSTMNPTKIELAKFALNKWLRYSKVSVSECAVIGFNDNNFLLHDFSQDSTSLSQSLNNVTPRNSEILDSVFRAGAFGLFNFIGTASNTNKVIIIITDGISINYQSDYAELFNRASELNIPVYILSINSYINYVLDQLSESTQGHCYNYLNNQNDFTKAIKQIALKMRQVPTSYITYRSTNLCNNLEKRLVQLKYKPNNAIDKLEYDMIGYQSTYLSFDKSNIHFTNPPMYLTSSMNLVVKANNGSINVTDITSSNVNFDINPKNFILNSGASRTLTVTYKPNDLDSSYNWTNFNFVTDKCPYTYNASAGYKGIKPKNKTLKVTSPVGGEVICGGGDTLITWEGIPATEAVKIELSLDLGGSWTTLAENAKGGVFIWKDVPKTTKNRCWIKATQIGDITGNTFVGMEFLHTIDTMNYNYTSYYPNWDKSGNRLITRVWNDYSVLWDAVSGDSLASFPISATASYWWYNSDSWSYTSEYFVNQFNNTIDIIYSTDTFTPVDTIITSTDGYYNYYDWYNNGAWYSNENKYIFSDDSIIYIYNLNSRSIIYSYNTHDTIFSVIPNPVNNEIVLVRGLHSHFILNTSTNEIINTYYTNYNYYSYWYANNFCWSPNGRYFVTHNSYYTIEIYDYTLPDPVATFNNYTYYDWSAGWWNYDGSYFLYHSAANELSIIETANWTLSNTYSYDPGLDNNTIHGAAWNPLNNYIAVSTWLGSLIILDGTNCEVVQRLDSVNLYNYYLDWNYNGEYFAISKYDGNHGLDIWKFSTNSTLQCDTSDAVFAIINPMVTLKTIDMGKVLINNSKDSLITDYITNEVNTHAAVDTIVFTGADADCFRINNGDGNFRVARYKTRDVEFQFTPNRTGIHSAVVNIIIHGDTTKSDIQGTGVEPKVLIVNNIINFGNVEINSFKDTIQAITIKNIGTTNLKIKEIKIAASDYNDFTIINGANIQSLATDSTAKLDLRFTPSKIGYSSGVLEIYYEGISSPAVVQLIGNAYILNPVISATANPFDDIICTNTSLSYVIIKNEGLNNLIISDIRFSGVNKDLFSIDFTSEISIKPDSSLILPLIFTSNSIGIKSANIEITSNSNPDALKVIPISVKKDSANIIPKSIEINMGTIGIDEAWSKVLDILNYGSTINKAIISTPTGFSIDNNEFLLPSASSKPITISYAGSPIAGSIDETFTVTDTICNRTVNVRIYGEVRSGAYIKSITDIYKYLSCDERSYQDSIYIENGGVGNISVNGISFTNPKYSLVAPFTQFDLAEGSGKYIHYQLSGADYGNNISDMLFNYTAGVTDNYTVKLNSYLEIVNVAFYDTELNIGNVCSDINFDTLIYIKNYGTKRTAAYFEHSAHVLIDPEIVELDANQDMYVNVIVSVPADASIVNESITLIDSVCKFSHTFPIRGTILQPKLLASKIEINGSIGNTLQGNLSIENKSNIEILINSLPIGNGVFTFNNNQLPITIAANSIVYIKVDYKADNNINDTLLTYLVSEPCGLSTEILLIGLPFELDVKLYTEMINAKVGDEINLPIYFQYSNEDAINTAGRLNAKITYNSTVLSPINYTAVIEAGSRGIINLEALQFPSTLTGTVANIRFKVGLGNADYSDINFESITQTNSNHIINPVNSTVSITNICTEGGKRLINTDSDFEMSINPNPVKSDIKISIMTRIKENSRIDIVNSIGEIVMTKDLNLETKQFNTISFDLSQLSDGLYYIRYSSNSINQTKSFLLMNK